MRSVRTFALVFHFLSVMPLYWTMVDSIQVSTESMEAWEDDAEKYRILISFSLGCLVFQALYMSRDVCVITFSDCAHIIVDVVGAFFTLWIAIDGLAWYTYIPLATTCM